MRSLLLFSLVFLISCDTLRPVFKPGAVVDLVNKKWMLTEISSDSINLLNDAYIMFSSDGEVSGWGGCNNYSGEYTISGNQLTIKNISSTEATCEASSTENKYFVIITQIDGFNLSGKTLILTKADYKIMSFQAR